MADGSIGLWTVALAVLGGAIRVSTPFLFVSLGECITERSGRINLGLEGTLIMGAMGGYGVSYLTGSPWLGVLAAVYALSYTAWHAFVGAFWILFVLRGVARLSAELGMSVVIEGVETERQLTLITREQSIDEAQGFLFSPPRPASQVREILTKFRGAIEAAA